MKKHKVFNYLNPYLLQRLNGLGGAGMSRMKIVSVQLPQGLINAMDQLVKKGVYPNRSEVIREAIRELLKRELYRLETTERSTPDYVIK